MLCSGVDPDGDPGTICESPAFQLELSRSALDGITLEGDGCAQWAESVTLHGTLDEGVFTVAE